MDKLTSAVLSQVVLPRLGLTSKILMENLSTFFPPGIKHCTTCYYEHEIDRLECNACARNWNASNYKEYIGWKPKCS